MNSANPFRSLLCGNVCFFGVGNQLRGDDALGPLLVERLRGRVRGECINAENAPEKYLGKVIKLRPDTLLIIDAVHLGIGPGDYRIVSPGELSGAGFSTHDIPIKDLIAYIKAEIELDIYILGVQPGKAGIGDGLSEQVKSTLCALEELIVNCYGHE